MEKFLASLIVTIFSHAALASNPVSVSCLLTDQQTGKILNVSNDVVIEAPQTVQIFQSGGFEYNASIVETQLPEGQAVSSLTLTINKSGKQVARVTILRPSDPNSTQLSADASSPSLSCSEYQK